LSNSGRWVAGFEIIIGFIITSLLDNHVIVIVVFSFGSLGLGLVLLLLFFNVMGDDLVENAQSRLLALFGALAHGCGCEIGNLLYVLLFADDVIEFFDFEHVLDN